MLNIQRQIFSAKYSAHGKQCKLPGIMQRALLIDQDTCHSAQSLLSSLGNPALFFKGFCLGFFRQLLRLINPNAIQGNSNAIQGNPNVILSNLKYPE